MQVRLGDARVAMPANLAQGGAMAVEEAAEFAVALSKLGPQGTGAAKAFHAARSRRVRCCAAGSRFTDAIGAPQSTAVCKIRDAALKIAVPKALFDATLWLSLGAGYRAPLAS